MKINGTKSLSLNILFSAIIWGLVIISCATKLKESGQYPEISNILYGGFIASFIIQLALVGIIFTQKKAKNEK